MHADSHVGTQDAQREWKFDMMLLDKATGGQSLSCFAFCLFQVRDAVDLTWSIMARYRCSCWAVRGVHHSGKNIPAPHGPGFWLELRCCNCLPAHA